MEIRKVQLGVPTEESDGYDEESAYKMCETIARDPMRYIYVSSVLTWWVTFFFKKFHIICQIHVETAGMLQLARGVLYVPPTETEAETAFSIQKWLLSGRRATMTPSNCNARMVGRSCKMLKRRIQEVQKEMQGRKKQKIN